MKHLKSFHQLNEEVKDFDIGFDLASAIENTNQKDLEHAYWEGLGKSGELMRYMNTRHYEFKFGMLKALFHDAIAFKKRRELTKGLSKFVIRMIPVAFGPVALPVMIIGKIFGISRAFNKVITPILAHVKTETPYASFLKDVIAFTFDIMEGDVTRFIGQDWYYNIFYMDKGLVEMIKKEYMFEFANFLADKMANEPDDKAVPYHYVENEFRRWINTRFEINPPLPLEKRKKGDLSKLLSLRGT